MSLPTARSSLGLSRLPVSRFNRSHFREVRSCSTARRRPASSRRSSSTTASGASSRPYRFPATDGPFPMTAGRLIAIEDADDPRIAEFRDIRERDMTGRQGRFMAEGTVVLRLLAQAHASGRDFVAEKILLLRNRVAGLAEIISTLPPDVPVYVADAPVLDGIVGFHLHRGVLALGRRIAEPDIG